MRRRRGFTLIELVVAFGIVALGTALAVPAYLRLVQDDELTRATRSVEALFRIARDSAIAGGRPVTVVVDSLTSQVWLDVAERPGDPDEVGAGTGAAPLDVATLGLPGTVDLAVPAARARFTFGASGQAFGDSVLLISPTGRRVVSLDRWTGDVRVR